MDGERGEGQDRRLGARPQIDVLEQVVRELPDREDVDEVEEQLQRGYDALRAARARNGDLHRAILRMRVRTNVRSRIRRMR